MSRPLSPLMTSLTLDAIACKAEDAVVVDYILQGNLNYNIVTIKIYSRWMNEIFKIFIVDETIYSFDNT